MQKEEKLRQIPLDLIDPLENLLRRRIDEEYIRELAYSIKEKGLINPISLRPEGNRYRLMAGYCRWLAHRWLGRDKILSRIYLQSEAEMMAIAAIENLQRKDLDPLEEAQALRIMIENEGYAVSDLATKLGKSEVWIRGRLETLNWPEEFLSALAEKKLSLTALKELLAIEDVVYRDHLLKIGIENGITGNVAKGWAMAWRETQFQIPVEDLPTSGPHVDRPIARILLPCWGCGVEHPPADISYKPLCQACIKMAMGQQ